jgi:ABC-2 type transport system ATP-binding protein
MDGRCVLSLQDVTIRYGDTVAVNGVSLQVAPGEIYGLLGPNGSGKSSTLAAIAGIVTPSAGVIQVAGLRLDHHSSECRRRTGVVPQELAFYEELSPTQNLDFFGRLYGLSGSTLRDQVQTVLEQMQLSHQAHRPARALSGGEQRRLNLGCALVHDPILLLLDEPSVGLDVRAREAIFTCLRELRERGCAMVYTTHHLEEVEALCDRIGIMSRGRLVAEGTLDELAAPTAAGGLESTFLSLTGGNRVAA